MLLPKTATGCICVSRATNTGIGISSDAQKRVFERFTQADETIIDRFGGTGLGLAIARQLVQLQGGNIGVQQKHELNQVG